jgi:murein DD-endopeptidase MepM/ murein hydrolase activator NlpD
MKHSLVITVFLFTIAAIINNSPISEPIDNAKNGVVIPLRYAQLLAQTPDETIAVPVKGIRPSQIADTWHAPRRGGRQHKGQDIFAKRGTPVTSATDGVVIRVGENNLGGNTVSILGAGGRVYYYAHLDGYAEDLNIGDPVSPESVIGYVGTTGNADGTPPHLHFGVYTMSGAINPIGLFENDAR